MKVKPSVKLFTLSAAVFSAFLLAQSDSAFDNAGDNAAFKRCATEHPSQAEARQLERESSGRYWQPGNPLRVSPTTTETVAVTAAVAVAVTMAAAAPILSYPHPSAAPARPVLASFFT